MLMLFIFLGRSRTQYLINKKIRIYGTLQKRLIKIGNTCGKLHFVAAIEKKKE